MGEGAVKIDEKVVKRIEDEQVRLRKELNKRRKLTRECMMTWSDISAKSLTELTNLMGVDF